MKLMRKCLLASALALPFASAAHADGEGIGQKCFNMANSQLAYAKANPNYYVAVYAGYDYTHPEWSLISMRPVQISPRVVGDEVRFYVWRGGPGRNLWTANCNASTVNNGFPYVADGCMPLTKVASDCAYGLTNIGRYDARVVTP